MPHQVFHYRALAEQTSLSLHHSSVCLPPTRTFTSLCLALQYPSFVFPPLLPNTGLPDSSPHSHFQTICPVFGALSLAPVPPHLLLFVFQSRIVPVVLLFFSTSLRSMTVSTAPCFVHRPGVCTVPHIWDLNLQWNSIESRLFQPQQFFLVPHMGFQAEL